jgi:hypothetical protein
MTLGQGRWIHISTQSAIWGLIWFNINPASGGEEFGHIWRFLVSVSASARSNCL